MHYDLYDNLHFVPALNPASDTAGRTSAAIDLLGFQSLMFLVETGALATVDGSNYLTFTIQASDDGSTNWTTITDPNVMLGATAGVFPNLDGTLMVANSTYKFGLTGTSLMKRYVRLVATKTGTISVIYGVTAMLNFARHAPIS